MNKKVIVVLICVCAFVLILFALYFCRNVEHYDFASRGNSTPFKISIIAGTHGNEPAGSLALEQLLDSGYFERYTLQSASKTRNIQVRVIPRVNSIGLKLGVRHQPHPLYPDINRNYTYDQTRGEDGVEPVSKAITDLTKDSDLVIDLHEGWGYHLVNPESIGSTLSHSGNSDSLAGKLSQIAVESLNTLITSPSKKFVVLDPGRYPACDIRSTLRCVRHLAGKNYILIETTGQNDIQPMHVRVGQHIHLIDSILNALR